MSWKKVKLGDVCSTIKTGKTPPTSNPDYFEGLVNWFSPSDIGANQYLKVSARTITEKAIDDKKAVIYEKDSILLTCIGEIGRCGILKKDSSSNQQITAIKFKSFIEPRYGYYWFIRNKRRVEQSANNAVVPILNNAGLRAIDFEYPLLHIQKQIANILDKADALRKKDQQLLQKYDELAQSIFIDMFGDPVKNEKGWEVKKLSEFGKIQTGNTPPRIKKQYYGDHIEWIKSDNILMENIFPTKAIEYLSEEGLKYGRSVCPGSLLITCIAGSPKTIGNVILTDRKVSFNQQINSFTPKSEYDNLFMYFLFRNCKSIIQGSTTQGMKRIITKSNFENIEFILPPLRKQKEFKLKISSQILLMDKMKKQTHKSETLFQSLLEKAFTRELINA